MEYFSHHLEHNLNPVFNPLDISVKPRSVKQKFFWFIAKVSSIGSTTTIDDYEKRKLGIFNQLNFFQLITGVIVPIAAFIGSKKFPAEGWYVAILPAFVSLFVLTLNYYHKYQAALFCYFIFYPVFTCFIYINGLNLGIELSFVLYGILSVFFLQDIGYMLFAISLSMISYFVLSITWKQYRYQLELYNYAGYLINQALAILYIFYGLFLIKRENSDYQSGMVWQNRELHKKNLEIESQKKEILHKAKLMEKQATELRDLNMIKSKLFSIISHDLKSPMYALQNLFNNAKSLDLPAEEIKAMIPDVVNDLNFTTSLIENLLQWAKCQMQSTVSSPQILNVSKLAGETVRLLHLQAEAKKISVETKTDLSVCAWADKNMINLVLRNLLSNAIKFTPEHGRIVIGTFESSSCAEIYIQDTGMGISEEIIKKINSDKFYSTNGTNSETGTGLGLMLCKEFLTKNDGRLMIESSPGVGSTFSFTLPLPK